MAGTAQGMNRRRTGESSGDEWKTGTIPKWWLLQKIFEIKTLVQFKQTFSFCTLSLNLSYAT
jgi:hypothetical protein